MQESAQNVQNLEHRGERGVGGTSFVVLNFRKANQGPDNYKNDRAARASPPKAANM